MGNDSREPEFNYDLERMQRYVESPSVSLPTRLRNKGDIRKWLLEIDVKPEDVGLNGDTE